MYVHLIVFFKSFPLTFRVWPTGGVFTTNDCLKTQTLCNQKLSTEHETSPIANALLRAGFIV